MNTMHVDDFTVLGRTVPEESRKYGKRICMAGYSPENNQFLRVYPLKVPFGENADANGFKARYVYSMDLRRNPTDNRSESWRLADENMPTKTAWGRAAETPTQKVVEWLSKHVTRSIKALNDCRLSLGVLRLEPDEWEGYSIARDAPNASEEHLSLFEDLEDQEGIDANAIKFAPYIRFTDPDGEHNLQVREWGAYRLLVQPKYADTPDALWSANAYRKDHGKLLIVGNMCNHRSNWLIIKTFDLQPAAAGPTLFD
jgi:hypothetical protein